MLQDSANSWKAFSASCRLQKHFPCKKLSRCLKKWSSVCKGSDGIWQMKQNFVAQFSQLLQLVQLLVVHCAVGTAMESWALSVDQHRCRHCSFQWISSACWAYFSDVMVLPGFRKLQWMSPAADHLTMTMTFCGAHLALGSALELLRGLTTALVVASCQIKSIAHHILIKKWFAVAQHMGGQHFKTTIFKIFGQLMRHPLIKCFHLSNLLQTPNDHRTINFEFLCNFSCGCKRIGFNNGSYSEGQPLCSSSSRLSSALQNLLSHRCTVYSLAVPGPSTLLQVVSTPL